MATRGAPRRSARNSPPIAGAPSNAGVETDIAPVAAAPSFRTPGKTPGSARPAWRGPGAKENVGAPAHHLSPRTGPTSRKLDARSPASAAMTPGRSARPKFASRTPGGSKLGTPSRVVRGAYPRPSSYTPGKNLPPLSPAQNLPRSPMAELAHNENTLVDVTSPLGAFVPATEARLTPPSARRRDGDAAAAAAAERRETMAPGSITPFSAAKVLKERRSPRERGRMGTSHDDDDDDDDEPDEVDEEEVAEEPDDATLMPPPPPRTMAMTMPEAEPLVDAPVKEDAKDEGEAPAAVAEWNSPAMAELTGGHDLGLAPRDLPTPTMALDAATVALRAMEESWAEEEEEEAEDAAAPAAAAAAPAEEEETSEAPPVEVEPAPAPAPEVDEVIVQEAAVVEDGARAAAVAAAYVDTIEPAPAPAAADAAASPLAAPTPSTRSPLPHPPTAAGAGVGAATPFNAKRSQTPNGQTPQWARNSKAWHEQQATQLTNMMERVAHMTHEHSHRAAEESYVVHQQTSMLQKKLEMQERELAAQREALEQQSWQMKLAADQARKQAEAAASEQFRMREELQRQMAAQQAAQRAMMKEEEETRRKLTEMAAAAVKAVTHGVSASGGASGHGPAGQPSGVPAAAPAPAPAPAPSGWAARVAASYQNAPKPPAPVATTTTSKALEDELLACRRAIQQKNAESDAVARRLRELQREESELALRAAELSRHLMRTTLEGEGNVPPLAPFDYASIMLRAPEGASPKSAVDAISRAAAYAAGGGGGGGESGGGEFLPLTPVAAGGGSVYTSSAAAAAAGGPAMDADGFIVMDMGYGVPENAAPPPAAGAEVKVQAPAATAAATATVTATATAQDVAAAPALVPEPAEAPPATGAALVATYKRPIQTIELKKEVVALHFLGGAVDASDAAPRMLMTATSDGCVRLFEAGARRAAGMVRGPKCGIVDAASAGTEAYLVPADAAEGIARVDLSNGRELGGLSCRGDGDDDETAARELSCVAAGERGSSIVVAAGEGGDVFVWDTRVGPRGSSRRSVGGAARSNAGCAPVMTLHVAGAARVSSLALGGYGDVAGAAPASVAVVASNGAKVFDLRNGGSGSSRPTRLQSREPGTRWCGVAKTSGGEFATLSTTGDVTAWRQSGAGYAPVRTMRNVAGVTENTNSHSSNASFAPAFATSAGSLAVAANGDVVSAFDVTDGSTASEWNISDGMASAGGGNGFVRNGWGHGVNDDGEIVSLRAAAFGFGAESQSFGASSFALGFTDGVVRVYGPGDSR